MKRTKNKIDEHKNLKIKNILCYGIGQIMNTKNLFGFEASEEVVNVCLLCIFCNLDN